MGRSSPRGIILHVSRWSVLANGFGTLAHQTKIWFITPCPQIYVACSCMVRMSYTMSLLFRKTSLAKSNHNVQRACFPGGGGYLFLCDPTSYLVLYNLYSRKLGQTDQPIDLWG